MKKRQAPESQAPIALGSGLAATLLFIILRQGTFLALFLASLAPLPLMIAALGFGDATGLGAAVVAVLSFAALVATSAAAQYGWVDAAMTAGISALIFAASQVFPAWWLARLAQLNRPDPALPWSTRRDDKAAEYYPLGLIVFQAALIGFAIVAVATLIVSLGQANFDASLDGFAAKLAPLIAQALSSYDLPNQLDPVELARLAVRAMPPAAAGMIFLALLLNLWLAGRIVQISNRLARPWPDIPHELRVPRLLGVALAAGSALCLLRGIVGMIASTATAVLAILFALQGLCLIHALSRGIKFRAVLLCALYLALPMTWPVAISILTIIGLVEAGFCLRDRKAAAAAPHS